MSKLLLSALAALAFATGAPAAQAATLLSVTAGNDPRLLSVNISASGGSALEVSVSGTADGIITITDPGGVTYTPLPSIDSCSVVSAFTVTCGSVADPVTGVGVYGGGLGDTVDLSGLARQARSSGPFNGIYPAAGDVDMRMRGIFAHVLTMSGADTITGGAVGASFEPGPGDDTVNGGPGDELVRAEATPDGDDNFVGGGGFDTATYARRTAGVTVTLSDGVTPGNGGTGTTENDMLSGVEAVAGTPAADSLGITGFVGGLGTLAGYGGDDVLTGGPGSDKLTGGAGADELRGQGGDDQLSDNRQNGEAQGLLNGGPGDDELIQHGMSFSATAADSAPVCGEGVDVLRADYGIDDGVSNTAGPADCEFLGNYAASNGTITGEVRVGKTVTAVPSPDLKGTPITGRVTKVKWYFCPQTSMDCVTRWTDGLDLTLLPGDVGWQLEAAHLYLAEPASQAPRWVEERGGTAGQGLVISSLWPPVVVVQAEAPEPIALPVVVKPDAAALLKAFKGAFGKKPKVSLLRKAATLKFTAPAGTSISVSVSVKKGKRTTTLARGTTTAAANGKVALKLKPTAAGRKAAKGKTSLSVRLHLGAKPPLPAVGSAETSSTLKLTAK